MVRVILWPKTRNCHTKGWALAKQTPHTNVRFNSGNSVAIYHRICIFGTTAVNLAVPTDKRIYTLLSVGRTIPSLPHIHQNCRRGTAKQFTDLCVIEQMWRGKALFSTVKVNRAVGNIVQYKISSTRQTGKLGGVLRITVRDHLGSLPSGRGSSTSHSLRIMSSFRTR